MKRNFSVLLFLLLISFNAYDIRLQDALERFELNELKIYATKYSEHCGWSAQIVDKKYNVYSLLVGNFIGKNVGKVTKIERDKIYITQIIKNEEGDWVEEEIIFDNLYWVE